MHAVLTQSVLICVLKLVSCGALPCTEPPNNEHFFGANIALHRTASHSPNDYYQNQHPASFAVDGNCNSDFYKGTCSHTNINYGVSPKWTVRFDRTYQLSGIIIYNRDGLEYRLKNFTVTGICDQQRNILLYEDVNKDPQQYNNTKILIELDGRATCSSISIHIPRDNAYTSVSYLTLCEVQVYAVGCRQSRVPPQFGFFNPNKTWYTPHESFTVQCQEGYKPSSNHHMTCDSQGRWSGNLPTCVRVYCNLPTPPAYGKYSSYTHDILMPMEYGSTIVGICYIGYESQVSNTDRQCTNEGTWSGQAPVCTPVHCSELGNAPNSHYTYANYSNYTSRPEVLNTIVYGVCNTGYHSSSATRIIRTCQSDKTWSEQAPVCTLVFCKEPLAVLNGYYTPASDIQYNGGSQPYNTKLSVVCNTGYQTNVADAVQTCLSNATWSGVRAECRPVRCNPPPSKVTHGYYSYSNNSRYDWGDELYNTSLIGVCDTGYKLRANGKLHCDNNGIWNGSPPMCDIVTCKRPDDFDNGYYHSHNHGADVFIYNNELHTVCEKGFTLKSAKNIIRICEASGKWSGNFPVCEQITCPWPLELPGGHYQPTNDTKNRDNLPMDKLLYNTTLAAMCNEGYSLNNDYTHRQCDEGGSWNGLSAICIQLLDDADSNGKTSSLAMIVGASTGSLVVLVVITAVGILFYRKRRAGTKPKREYNDIRTTNNQSEGEYAEIQESSLYQPATQSNTVSSKNDRSPSQAAVSAPDEDELSHEYYSFQANKRIPKSALKVEALSDIVLNGDAAKSRFVKEFEKLPHGMVEDHKEALKTENIGKHRYKQLFAYDHSRVVLQKDNKDQSDYINACYVNGFSKVRAYIASQGPTKETLNDFWRMVWRTDCTKIVMLTKLVEERKPKCAQYWPDELEVVYGDITVTLKKSESFSEFVIRTFTVKKHNSKAKHVAQFHFTAWPDKGVPKYASSLVQFRNKVKYASTRGDGPIVVHCSAGVGRTGTFIALDYLTDQANAAGYVDVFGSVEGMRRQRVLLVQTLEQYIFLHHALVETLMLSTSALPSNQFPEWFKSILQVDHRKKKRKLDIEFETLSRLSPTADEHQYFTAKQVRNRKKNRYSNVLPVDEFMPQLEPLESSQDDTTYINAVFLPSYKHKNAFIITQTPLEGTIDDFWRLIWEHDIHVIVMMNKANETSRAEQYWPNNNDSMASRNITIKHTKTEEIKNHKLETFSLQKHMITRNVVQVQCGGWQADNTLPDSKDAMLSLLDIVQTIQRKTGDQPVLVHCMNGADKSGLFCVISAVIERMKIEQDVAITHVIEEMRNAREQIIPSVEQYQFCHEVVLAYIEDFSTYSNFSL